MILKRNQTGKNTIRKGAPQTTKRKLQGLIANVRFPAGKIELQKTANHTEPLKTAEKAITVIPQTVHRKTNRQRTAAETSSYPTTVATINIPGAGSTTNPIEITRISRIIVPEITIRAVIVPITTLPGTVSFPLTVTTGLVENIMLITDMINPASIIAAGTIHPASTTIRATGIENLINTTT